VTKPIGFYAKDIKMDETVLEMLTISAEHPDQDGGSSYGIKIIDSPKMIVRGCVIISSSGSHGIHGSNGYPGAAGGLLGLLMC
jgi:hypothetical protein